MIPHLAILMLWHLLKPSLGSMCDNMFPRIFGRGLKNVYVEGLACHSSSQYGTQIAYFGRGKDVEFLGLPTVDDEYGNPFVGLLGEAGKTILWQKSVPLPRRFTAADFSPDGTLLGVVSEDASVSQSGSKLFYFNT
jgi:hypothetical protein